MTAFRSWSIQTKLFGSMAALTVIASTYLLFGVPAQQAKLAFGGLEAKALSAARLVAYSAQAGVGFDDAKSVAESYQGLLSDPDLAYVRVVNAAGAELSSENLRDVTPVWKGAPGADEVPPVVGTHTLEVAVPVKSTSKQVIGGVQIGFSLDRLAAQRRSFRSTAIVLALLLLGAGGALAWGLGKAVGGPLKGILEATEAVGQGDLTRTINVDSQDEIGTLARRFQDTTGRLRSIVGTLKLANGELGSAVTGLTSLTRSQNGVVQRQASALAETSTTTAEIQQTSALAAAKAETVLQVAARAEEFGVTGQAAVEDSLRGLSEIRSQIDAIVGKIADLSERTLQIGEITETVKDLADQSNVLALNAAIEAAKAGEFGKGFAVVAREIRSLADQSIQSTARIRDILSEVQGAIRSTAAITDEGKHRMEQNIEQIRASGESLREMAAISREASQAARQIAASVSQQNVGITQISEAMSGLNVAMEETVEGIQQADHAAENLRSISGKISGIVESFRS